MIEFKGEVSKECNQWISNRMNRVIVFSWLFASTIVSVPILFACIYWSWIFVIFIIVFYGFVLFLMLFMVLFPDKWKQTPTIYMAVIKDSLIAKVKTEKGKIIKYGNSIEYVKNVIDYGDWYHITFYVPHRNPFFICQKDLISEGTIEEFEELFADKLVRKKRKGNKS